MTSNSEFIPDIPEEKELEIWQKCNRHAQLMEKIGELVVGLQDEKIRHEALIADQKELAAKVTKLRDTEIKLINFRLDALEKGNSNLINARLVAVLERMEEKIKQGA